MNNITVDTVMSRNPCDAYPIDRVKSLFAGREVLTICDLLGLDIPEGDRWWAFAHCDMATDGEYRIIACDIINEITMPLYDENHPDYRHLCKTLDTVRPSGAAVNIIARNAVAGAAWYAANMPQTDSEKDKAWFNILTETWAKVFGIARRYQ